jgi:rsbT co-antagonist protein RsbR
MTMTSSELTHLQEENDLLRAQLAQYKEAAQRSQLLQLLFQHLPVAAFAKAADDGQFTLWNTASEELFGFPAQAVLGKNDYDFFPKEQADFFRQKDTEVFDLGRALIIPAEPVDSHSLGRRILRTIKVPIFDEDGAPTMLLVISVDITDQLQVAEERERLQEQVIEAQRIAIQEISTPLIPLTERVLLLPLIGSIDSHRAQRVIETLLSGIAENHADLVILDITGVQLVDTMVANALIRAAQAARLLGANVMLTGIRPEVAQTLVQLGLSLEGISTRGALQVAIKEAFVK